MTHSKPDCKNYISEDLCANSSHRPEVHCHDDEGRACASYSAAKAETTQGKHAPVISLDMDD